MKVGAREPATPICTSCRYPSPAAMWRFGFRLRSDMRTQAGSSNSGPAQQDSRRETR